MTIASSIKPDNEKTKGKLVTKSVIAVHVAAVMGLAVPAGTALAGPLDDYTRLAGGSPVQIDIATAIQSICPQLVSSMGGLPGALAAPDSPQKDITLRCNELIFTAVDLANPNGPPPSRSLGYTEGDQLFAALQEVTGEESVAQNTMTARAANSQYSNVAARLDALRFASAGAATPGGAAAFNFDVNEFRHHSDSVGGYGVPVAALGGGASADDGETPADGLSKRRGVFAMGSYNTGDRDASLLEDGFEFDTVNLTVGFDQVLSGGSVIGVAVGYDDFGSDFHVSDVVSGGDVEADGFSVSVFGSKDFGQLYLDAIAGFGKLDYSIDRVLRYDSQNMDPNCQCGNQDRLLSADTDGDYYSVSLSAGWRINRETWLIQPTVSLSARNYQIDGYTEQDLSADGGMPLRYGDQDIDSLRSIIGVQFQKAVSRSFGVLRPSLHLSWHHEFEDDPNVISAKYALEDDLAVTDPGLGFSSSLNACLSCFQLVSDAPDQDFAVIGAGLTFVFPNSRVFTLYYEGLFGYRDLDSNAISASFRTQF